MLRDEVAEVLTQLASKSHYFNEEEMRLYLDSYVTEVCNLFKAELDKLAVTGCSRSKFREHKGEQ